MRSVRIEIICTSDGDWRATSLDLGLRQALREHRDDALRRAMAWAMEAWRCGLTVDIVEYVPGTVRVRWSAAELSDLADLRDLAECARDAARFAEEAAE
ncbi:MAG: hypothetical protein OXC11_12260 [Rhodospirillales bacterium]|nr:hypothetical protein [Rhodospirillales bacterium]